MRRWLCAQDTLPTPVGSAEEACTIKCVQSCVHVCVREHAAYYLKLRWRPGRSRTSGGGEAALVCPRLQRPRVTRSALRPGQLSRACLLSWAPGVFVWNGSSPEPPAGRAPPRLPATCLNESTRQADGPAGQQQGNEPDPPSRNHQSA